MKKANLQKHKLCKSDRGFLHQAYSNNHAIPRQAYFTHPKMIVGVMIGPINTKLYWNGTKQVLLDAIYNGHSYRLGLSEYKSERSLVLRINNFVKHILNDNNDPTIHP